MSFTDRKETVRTRYDSFLGFQRSFFLAQEGTLDVGLRDSIRTAVNAVKHLPGIYLYCKQRRAYFQPEFISWVESLLQKQPLTDMRAYREFLSG